SLFLSRAPFPTRRSSDLALDRHIGLPRRENHQGVTLGRGSTDAACSNTYPLAWRVGAVSRAADQTPSKQSTIRNHSLRCNCGDRSEEHTSELHSRVDLVG